ncbi:TetR/AcrR family transcriptional regulator [uncultured Roseibium sp.]|uniref:TetR/AcrR family transcriptional regulator n=1 Tax=uncultured Roseibium sp. TaxID=1936171 RepID=UPI003216F46A
MDRRDVTQIEDTETEKTTPRPDTAKYRQILNGAREVFLSHGYDGASMDQIARTAGVSKGTLYVYFPGKEALFRELILKDRLKQAEALLDCAAGEGNLRDTLTKIGRVFIEQMFNPERLSTIRMVIGATEKFPEFGNLLYEAGPKKGMETFGRFLKKYVAKGELTCPDTELAAAQFMDLCSSRIGKRAMFQPGHLPAPEDVDANVASAVHMFLAAYGTGK